MEQVPQWGSQAPGFSAPHVLILIQNRRPICDTVHTVQYFFLFKRKKDFRRVAICVTRLPLLTDLQIIHKTAVLPVLYGCEPVLYP
jgi:hypothetical protein